MATFSKSSVTFGWEQVIKYMASVTCDSVEKITVPFLYYMRYQKDLICIVKSTQIIKSSSTIVSPNKSGNPI